jgi:hypothetical protein
LGEIKLFYFSLFEIPAIIVPVFIPITENDQHKVKISIAENKKEINNHNSNTGKKKKTLQQLLQVFLQ